MNTLQPPRLPWPACLWLPTCSARRLTEGGTGGRRDFSLTDTFMRPLPVEEMAAHSSIPAWRVPWIEEPGGLQSMGSQRVGHDWSDVACSTQACLQEVACVGGEVGLVLTRSLTGTLPSPGTPWQTPPLNCFITVWAPALAEPLHPSPSPCPSQDSHVCLPPPFPGRPCPLVGSLQRQSQSDVTAMVSTANPQGSQNLIQGERCYCPEAALGSVAIRASSVALTSSGLRWTAVPGAEEHLFLSLSGSSEAPLTTPGFQRLSQHAPPHRELGEAGRWECCSHPQKVSWQTSKSQSFCFLCHCSERQRSLMGCHLWGRTESDTTEATWWQQQQLWEKDPGKQLIISKDLIIFVIILHFEDLFYLVASIPWCPG